MSGRVELTKNIFDIPCTNHPVEGDWDVIVIGSGMSGLATATSLAMKRQKVLVLEKHFHPGGFTHVFRRKDFEWDVGLHYIGSTHPDSNWFVRFVALCEGNIEFVSIGDKVDTLKFPDMEVIMPNSYEDYKKVLIRLFPEEEKGINSYIDEIAWIRKKLSGFYMLSLLPKIITKILQWTLFHRMYNAATTTTEKMMNRYFKNEKLQQVLDAQWGNIGLPKKLCSFMVHAAMLGMYLEKNVVYPKGGSSVFAKEIGKVLYKYGGQIRIRAGVKKVIIEGKTAVGVELENGEKIYAKKIISSIGANNTFRNLLEGNPRVKHIIKKLDRLPLAYEYVNLFLGFDCNPKEFGLNQDNFWIMRDWDSDPSKMFWDIDNPEKEGQPYAIFVNSSSQKDMQREEGKGSGHNAQVLFFIKQGYFRKWEGTQWMKRGEEYNQVKEKIVCEMMKVLERYFPGINRHVLHKELGTPLSYITFTGHIHGVPYGIAPTPDRYRSTILRPATPIKNFYLVGQDLIMAGISAAIGSSLLTASIVRLRNISSFLYERGLEIMKTKKIVIKKEE